MNNTPQIALFSVFAAVVLFFLSRILRYGGFRGALMGARIRRTPGEVKGSSMALMKLGIKVHVLEGRRDGKDVGVEFFAKSPLSWQTMPVTLSDHEAERLAALLKEAVDEVRTSKGS